MAVKGLVINTHVLTSYLYGGVKRPHPTIHNRHVYKAGVTSTKHASRLQISRNV